MRLEVAKLEAKALGKFTEAIGARLAKRVKPSLRASAGRGDGELRASYCRQSIAAPDKITCLCCDESALEYLRLRIDRHSPFGHLPQDAIVYLLFCGSDACKTGVDKLADVIACVEDDVESESRSN